MRIKNKIREQIYALKVFLLCKCTKCGKSFKFGSIPWRYAKYPERGLYHVECIDELDLT